MRHHNTNRKLGRESAQRRALLRSLAESLIIRGRIHTTEARAKEMRPFVEKMITKGKTNTLTSRRMIISALGSDRVAGKLIKIAESYKERPGGYIRILKEAPRKGDASPMALIEFV